MKTMFWNTFYGEVYAADIITMHDNILYVKVHTRGDTLSISVDVEKVQDTITILKTASGDAYLANTTEDSMMFLEKAIEKKVKAFYNES